MCANFNNRSSAGDEGGGDGSAPAADDNRNQMLLAKSTDGGTVRAPVKVGDYYDLPDCDTYQGAARTRAAPACRRRARPRNSIFRADQLPVGRGEPDEPAQVVVTYGSYINSDSNETNGCVPAGFGDDGINVYTGVKTPGACNNKILMSVSSNGGASFTGRHDRPARAASDRERRGAGDNRPVLAVGGLQRGRQARGVLLRPPVRQRRDDRLLGLQPVRLEAIWHDVRDQAGDVTRRCRRRPQFAGQFFGDYTGLDAVDDAHPIWMDTRDPDLFLCRDSAGRVTTPPSVCTASAANADVANDQNVYTRRLSIPLP